MSTDQEILMLLTKKMKFSNGIHRKIIGQNCQVRLGILELTKKVIFGLSDVIKLEEDLVFTTGLMTTGKEILKEEL